MKINSYKQKGFTLVELLLVMGVFAILSSLVTINLLRPQIKSTVDRGMNTLIADTRLQQIKAMVGEDLNTGNPEEHGIYFETANYILFKGNTYNASDPNNISIDLDEGVSFTTINLPGSQIVFSRLSGEVSNYSSSQNSVIVEHSQGVVANQITINKYGAITIN